MDRTVVNHRNNRGIRTGDWKLIAAGETGPWELYDLSKDRCELRNLASKHPERAQKMAAISKARDSIFTRARESSPPSTRPLLSRR